MLQGLRPLKGLCFILFVFIFSVTAQVSKNNRLEELKEEAGTQKEIIKKSDSLVEKKNYSLGANELLTKNIVKKDANELQKDYKLRRGDKEIQLEIGVAPFNPSNFAGPKEFDVYGRHLYLGTFRVGRVIGTKRNVSYEYLFGVTPLVLFTKNEVANQAYVSAAQTPNVAPTKRENTFGFGIQPVNFRFIFLAKNRLKPYAQVGAGLLFTQKAVPVPRSKPFNLTGEFGGGLMYMLTEKRAVNFGYKYFHISNGNIGGKINNPGFNANVFYVNYSFFWNRR